MAYRTTSSQLKAVGLREGFRSGLEDINEKLLRGWGIDPQYEEHVIEYVRPARKSKYHPDFRLPNGIFIETKGRFETDDRQKHLFIKAQHPELDIRFVFSNPKAKIRKGSPTTYADWCLKHGFLFAHKLIPKEWLS